MGEDAHLVAGELILGKAREAARVEDEAVENLVREQARLVYRVAYAVLRSHPDAEDVVQETFLRVLRNSHKLAGIENPRTWLAKIAWRLAIDRSQSGRRRQEVTIRDADRASGELAGRNIAADEILERTRAGEALERLVRALPKKLREPLILSTIEEMSPREAGAVLGINEAAVRSRVYRARQILKEKLAAEFGGREEKRNAGPKFQPRS
jgi:RNA polymerase sigma-70 factor, ECF subfamily